MKIEFIVPEIHAIIIYDIYNTNFYFDVARLKLITYNDKFAKAENIMVKKDL